MQLKDFLYGHGRKKLDNKGWGPFDRKVPLETAADELAPKWLRNVRSKEGGEPIGDAALQQVRSSV